MKLIPDDPIISSLLAKGYPPWMGDDYDDDYDDDLEDDGDVYYGNETDSF